MLEDVNSLNGWYNHIERCHGGHQALNGSDWQDGEQACISCRNLEQSVRCLLETHGLAPVLAADPSQCVPDKKNPEGPCQGCQRLDRAQRLRSTVPAQHVVVGVPCLRLDTAAVTVQQLEIANSAYHGRTEELPDDGSKYLLQKCADDDACELVQTTYKAVIDYEQILNVCQNPDRHT